MRPSTMDSMLTAISHRMTMTLSTSTAEAGTNTAHAAIISVAELYTTTVESNLQQVPVLTSTTRKSLTPTPTTAPKRPSLSSFTKSLMAKMMLVMMLMSMLVTMLMLVPMLVKMLATMLAKTQTTTPVPTLVNQRQKMTQ